LDAVAEPQSQNVHEKGQPRLVSHRTIQTSSGLAAIRGLKAPLKYGDGRVSISRNRPPLGWHTKAPSVAR